MRRNHPTFPPGNVSTAAKSGLQNYTLLFLLKLLKAKMLNEFIDRSFQEWFKKEFGRDYLSHNENDGRIKKAFMAACWITLERVYNNGMKEYSNHD